MVSIIGLEKAAGFGASCVCANLGKAFSSIKFSISRISTTVELVFLLSNFKEWLAKKNSGPKVIKPESANENTLGEFPEKFN